MTFEQKKIVMKSNIPINLFNQLKKDEEKSEEKVEEEVKVSQLDLMKKNVADLNKR